MRHARFNFGAFFLLFASTALTGCYTQLATDKGDYYTYASRPRHHTELLRSDTVVVHSGVKDPSQAELAPRYDTTMHGDTMFIDERPRAEATRPLTATNGETVINNYYGDDDYVWATPRPAVVVSFGSCDPWYTPWYDNWYHPWYHSWYSPWWAYYPSWYYPYDRWAYCGPYGYPGFYPPYYDAYAPYYGCGYPGYYPYYAGYYGHRHDSWHNDLGYVRPTNIGRGVLGEHRVSATPINVNAGSIAAHQPAMGGAQSPMAQTRTNSPAVTSSAAAIGGGGLDRNTFAHAAPNAAINASTASTASSMRDVAASRPIADVLPSSMAGDRNAPIHVVSPGGGGQVTASEPAIARNDVTSSSASTQRPIIVVDRTSRGLSNNSGMASTAAPAANVGRTSAPAAAVANTTTANATRSANTATLPDGRQVVVVRRGSSSYVVGSARARSSNTGTGSYRVGNNSGYGGGYGRAYRSGNGSVNGSGRSPANSSSSSGGGNGGGGNGGSGRSSGGGGGATHTGRGGGPSRE